MKKIIVGIIIIIVTIILIIVFGSNRQTIEPPSRNDIAVSTNTKVITYTDSGFNPSAIIIKKGDTVEFDNRSTRAFWPASNNHPVHSIYPEFDPKKSIPSGSSWSFTFERVGKWQFHNHLKFSERGTITVENI